MRPEPRRKYGAGADDAEETSQEGKKQQHQVRSHRIWAAVHPRARQQEVEIWRRHLCEKNAHKRGAEVSFVTPPAVCA